VSTRPQTFEPGTFLRPCDLCGIRYRANQLRKGEDGFWRCLAYCHEVPMITRDRVSAQSQRRKEAPPPPHGVPFDRRNAYSEEELVFNFICGQPVKDAGWANGFRLGVPPHDLIDCTNGGFGAPAANPVTGNVAYSVLAAAEACRYLYGIINENKRPLKWIATAKAKLRELADWLITSQRGFGTSPSSTKTNDGLYGGLASPDPVGSSYVTVENAAAGLAMLYAYRSLGDVKYLLSAQASATFLRNVQAAPNPPYLGALPTDIGAILSVTPFYSPSALLALEFWNELLTTSGDGQYGSDGTPVGFSVAPQQLLSQCIADLRAFWSVGAYNNATGGTVNGLSSASLCDSYEQAGTFKQWFRGLDQYSPTAGWFVPSRPVAIGLRSLFNYEGFSSQVADVWNYLMGFASNAAFTSAAGTLATDFACASTTNSANPPPPPVGQGNVIAPSYNPKLALSVTLLVRDLTTNVATATNAYDYDPWFLNTGQKRSTYDWATFGLLAAIQSSRDAGSFRKAKDAAIAGRLRTPVPFEYGATPVSDSPMLRGSSGLAFQLNHGDDFSVYPAARRLWSVTSAAMVGNAFRYQPQAFAGAPAPGGIYSQAAPGVQS
jgi:hypothetical protein